METKRGIVRLTQGAMIAAVYVVLTLVFAPISFREIQVRISEAMTILPLFTPTAIPGLAIGCVLSNLFFGAPLPDVIFGSLATLIGVVGTWLLRSKKPIFGVLPPIISNTLIVPFVLRYAYDITLPIPLLMLSVSAGEVLSCGVLGMALYSILSSHRNAIFKKHF